MKILVAESDPTCALILSKTLENAGHRAQIASDGPSALKKVRAGNWRLVISSDDLPGLNGLDLCRRIREEADPEEYTYVLLLLTRDDRASRLGALASGADDAMGKPIDLEELEQRLIIADRILAIQQESAQRAHDYQVASENLGHANEMLEVASKRFEALFNALPVACFTFDALGTVYEWNNAAAELWGIPASTALHQSMFKLIGGTDNMEALEAMLSAVLENRKLQEQEVIFAFAEDRKVWTVNNTFPLHGHDGRIVGGLAAWMDITDRVEAQRQIEYQLMQISDYSVALEAQQLALEQANRQLDVLANTDGLTGLLNRRAFREALDADYRLALDEGRPLSVLILDVDHFKSFNDTYGHQHGDKVLAAVAAALRAAIGEYGTPARYGGEEFVAVLPDADVARSILLAEVVRTTIEQQPWDARQVTASIGVCTLGPDVTSTDQMIMRADAALYASKHAGRNRVTHDRDVARLAQAA